MNIFQSETVSCKPISTLEDLLTWSPKENQRNFKIHKLDPVYHKIERTKQIIVCHDMKNNYLEDKYFQGANVSNCYSFYHWNLIDMFIYFSHHFVTIPPESWINAAHENNVRMLGTFITEFTNGEVICKKLFENLDETIKKLVEITVHYGFDGWLINIENKIEDMEKLKYFVKKLNEELKKINENLYKVIWYDSVIETGDLKWQNELNSLNSHFFDISDGFFVNYTWKEENLINTKLNSGPRYSNVYVGIDVFGRGCLGNGGFNCSLAFEEIFKHELSFALFAPGWIHECNEVEKFFQNSELFWSGLKKYTNRRKILKLPLITNFSHGSGKNFFLNGKKVSDSNNSWNNLNLQGLMPVLSDREESKLDWCLDDAFYGANCIEIKENSEQNIFDLEIKLKKGEVYIFEYVLKEDDESCYLSLDFLEEEIVKLEEVLKENKESNWTLRRFELKPNKDITLKSLNAVNKLEKPFKIGLVRFINSLDLKKQEIIKPKKSKIASIEHRVKFFQLENQIYLCIKLDWLKFDEDIKYFNVFINKYRNLVKGEEGIDLKYIGSTKSESFSICLKLDRNNIEIDSTHSSNNILLSFNLMVQAIDDKLNNLEEADQLFEASKIDNDSVKYVEIQILKLKIKNQNDSSFLDKIVFDFESF